MKHEYVWNLDGVTVNYLEMLFTGDVRMVKKHFGFSYTNHLFLVDHGHAQHFLSVRSRRTAERVGGRKFSSHAFVTRFVAGTRAAERQVNTVVRRLRRVRFSQWPPSRLWQEYDRYFSTLSTLLGYYRATRPEFTKSIVDALAAHASKNGVNAHSIFSDVSPQRYKGFPQQWKMRASDLALLGQRRYSMHTVWTPALRAARPLFAAIGRRIGLSVADVVNLTRLEIFRALCQGRRIAPGIRTRRRAYQFRYLSSRFAIEPLTGTLRAQAVKTRLTGQSAWPGIVRGRVFLLNETLERSLHAVAATMPRGRILVSVMTTPDMLMAIRRARAIVTDEGGMLSHASIVARELHIPTVVGTRHATKSLRDGDRVEVDATKGIVRKL